MTKLAHFGTITAMAKSQRIFFVSNQIATLNWFWSMQIPMTRTRELLAKETLSCCGGGEGWQLAGGWHWGGSRGFIRQCCWEGTLNFDLQWCATDTVSIYILQDYLCIEALANLKKKKITPFTRVSSLHLYSLSQIMQGICPHFTNKIKIFSGVWLISTCKHWKSEPN